MKPWNWLKRRKPWEWIKKRKRGIAVALGFLGYFALSYLIFSVSQLVGAYFIFTGLALLLVYYGIKT